MHVFAPRLFAVYHHKHDRSLSCTGCVVGHGSCRLCLACFFASENSRLRALDTAVAWKGCGNGEEAGMFGLYALLSASAIASDGQLRSRSLAGGSTPCLRLMAVSFQLRMLLVHRLDTDEHAPFHAHPGVHHDPRYVRLREDGAGSTQMPAFSRDLVSLEP